MNTHKRKVFYPNNPLAVDTVKYDNISRDILQNISVGQMLYYVY